MNIIEYQEYHEYFLAEVQEITVRSFKFIQYIICHVFGNSDNSAPLPPMQHAK
jgi:hypothetical protein